MTRRLKCECGECNVCKCRERARMKARARKLEQGASAETGPRSDPKDTYASPPRDRGSERVLRPRFSKKHPLDASMGPIEPEIDKDPMAAREEKIRHRKLGKRGYRRILLINRVGIPIKADVYKDGLSIVMRVALGNPTEPEEPVSYFNLAKLHNKPLGAGA